MIKILFWCFVDLSVFRLIGEHRSILIDREALKKQIVAMRIVQALDVLGSGTNVTILAHKILRSDNRL